MSMKHYRKGKHPVSVDQWLDSLDLYRKNIAYDETCLFRAVSEQIFDVQIYHERVRRQCITFGRTNYQKFTDLVNTSEEWQGHLDKLEKHMVVCGKIELMLVSWTYNRDVLLYHGNQQKMYEVSQRNLDTPPLMVCLMEDDHFDVIYKKDHILNTGMCQSIVYKILYEDVFKIPKVDDIVNAMLYEKTPVISQMELEDKKLITEEKNLSPEDVENAVIAPFPFKVAKALDPSIYRNIEYDSWGEVRREMRLGDWYYGDDKFKLGTKCLVKGFYTDEEEQYECYIQEFLNDQECVVYLTKLAEKRIVCYSDLAPENDAKPWPLPYRFSKNILSTPQLQSMDKVRMRRKYKRHNRSNNDNSSDDSVSPFVGAPLQIQTNSNKNGSTMIDDNSKVDVATETEPAGLPLSDNQFLSNSYWEQPEWSTEDNYETPECYPPSADVPYYWPPTPPVPFLDVASAPVTPNIVPYHHEPFFFNIIQEPVSFPLTPTTPIPIIASPDPAGLISHTPNMQDEGFRPFFHGPPIGLSNVAPPPPYAPITPQPFELYSHPHMMNIQAVMTGPPPDGHIVPSSPPPIYTPNPPMEYLTHPHYAFSPSPITPNINPFTFPPPPLPPRVHPTSSPPYNSNGFIFPTPPCTPAE